MPIYKFTWDQEFGWDDWRAQEWSVRAKNEREAWLFFYEEYGVFDQYIERLQDRADEGITIDEDEVLDTVKLEDLKEYTQILVESERLKTNISGAEIKKI